MKRSRETATYMRPICRIENGKIVHRTFPQEVRILARAEGYAMVRVKGGSTFAVKEKELALHAPRVMHGEQVQVTLRLTAAQREKLAALGGAAWVRAQIERARLPG